MNEDEGPGRHKQSTGRGRDSRWADPASVVKEENKRPRNRFYETLDRILPEIIAMSEDIYRHPELGFKGFRTEKTIEALDKAGIPHEDVAHGNPRCADSGNRVRISV